MSRTYIGNTPTRIEYNYQLAIVPSANPPFSSLPPEALECLECLAKLPHTGRLGMPRMPHNMQDPAIYFLSARRSHSR